jgi:hypothetical protein
VKNVKYEKYTMYYLEFVEKTRKHGKGDTNIVWPGIWRETLISGKMKNVHRRTWIMARKLKNVENETNTL